MTCDFWEGEEVYTKNFLSQDPYWLSGHMTGSDRPVSVVWWLQVENTYFSKFVRNLPAVLKMLAMSNSEEAEDASGFVSYPPENSLSHSEIDKIYTGTTSTEVQPTYSDNHF